MNIFLVVYTICFKEYRVGFTTREAAESAIDKLRDRGRVGVIEEVELDPETGRVRELLSMLEPA